MESDPSQLKAEANGPNSPTQVDNVSTTEVKTEGNTTTELSKGPVKEAEELVNGQERDGKT